MKPVDKDEPGSVSQPSGSRASVPGTGFSRTGLDSALLPAATPPPAVLAAPPDALRLLRGVRRRWLLALSLSVLGGVIAAGATWLFLPAPEATARALLHVDSTPPWVVFNKAEGQSNFQSYQRTQVALVKSRLVLNAALRSPAVAGFSIIRDSIDPVAWLQKELVVDFSVAPEILRIALSGDRPEEQKVLVEQVTHAYLEEIVNKEGNSKRERMDKLKEISDRYEDTLRRKRRTVRELSEAVGTGDPHTLALKQRFAQEQLASSQKELLQIDSDLRKLKIEVVALQGRDRSVADQGIPEAAMENYLQQDPVIRKYQARKIQLQQAIEDTLRIVVQGENDPTIRRYRSELKSTQTAIDTRMKELRPQVSKQYQEKLHYDARADLANIKERIALLEELKQTLTKDTARYGEESRALSKGSLDMESYKQEIAQAEETAKRVATELEALTVESRAPQRITELEKAHITQADDKKRRTLATVLAGFGVMGSILLFIGWKEHRARRVSSVDEVEQGLGIQLLGTVPAMPKQGWRLLGGEAEPSLEWDDQLAEALDATRTLLLHAAKAQSIHSVLITSAVGSEGKTSFAVQLAASLARSGRKTLLLDCDLRNPSAHQLFELPRGPGLSQLLCGSAELSGVIRETPLQNLWMVSAGDWDPAAVQGLSQVNFREMLTGLKAKYDFVVLDSSPVLPVADSLVIGQHVDGVILSILHEVSQMPKVYAAHQRLTRLGINVLGAVVSGTHTESYDADYRYVSQGEAEAVAAEGTDS